MGVVFFAGFFLPACGWNFEGGFAAVLVSMSHVQISLVPVSENSDFEIVESSLPRWGGFSGWRCGVGMNSD